MRLADIQDRIDAGEMKPEEFASLLYEDQELMSEVCLKIETKAGTEIPFVANNAQRIFEEACADQLARTGMVRKVVLKARQAGITTRIAKRGYRMTAWNSNNHGLVVAHTEKDTSKIFKIYKRFHDKMPAELRPMTKYDSRTELVFDNPSSDPKVREQNPGLGSSIGVFSAGSDGAARGSTNRFLHCSEVPQWPNTQELMLGLLQTVPKGDNARGTEIFIESTAKGVGDWFYNKYYAAKRRAQGEQFEALFIPWYVHEEYTAPVPSDLELTAEERDWVEADHTNWGYPNPWTGKKNLTLGQIVWRRNTLQTDCEGDVQKFRQEYPMTDDEAFIVTGNSFFDLDQVRARLEAVTKLAPLFVGEIEGEKVQRNVLAVKLVPTQNGKLTVWRQPEEGHRYVIFADVGSGFGGSDYSVVDIYDRADGFQCAQYRARVDPDDLGDVFYLMGKHYGWAWGSPEVNNHGLATLQRLKELRYPRLYVRKVYEKHSLEPVEKVGWMTSVRTRTLMIDTGKRAFRDDFIVINSTVTLTEMMTIVLAEDGKYKAQDGCFDDCWIAMSGGAQLLSELPKTNPRRFKPQLHTDEEVGDRVTGY